MKVQLNRRLVLETPQQVADGSGGFTTTWTVLGEIWAQVKPRSGNIVTGDVGPLSRVPMKIVTRAAPFGDPARPVAGQRLREGARAYEIEAVTEADDAGHYLVLFAEEEVAV